jgi:ElaB/YqjD/DUF883 family membrane-anchored ribosome-binding protein
MEPLRSPGYHPGNPAVFVLWSKAMASPSTVSSSIRDAAKEGVHDIGKAASAASRNIENDLQALRDDFARLAEQVSDIVAGKGDAAWQSAKASVDDVIAEAGDKGREAAEAMREMTDHFVEAVDGSLKERPYTTLAIVAGVGFVLGMIWRR